MPTTPALTPKISMAAPEEPSHLSLDDAAAAPTSASTTSASTATSTSTTTSTTSTTTVASSGGTASPPTVMRHATDPAVSAAASDGSSSIDGIATATSSSSSVPSLYLQVAAATTAAVAAGIPTKDLGSELTELQALIIEAIAEQNGCAHIDIITEYVSKRWGSVRRRDGSKYASDCRRAVQASLANHPSARPLFKVLYAALSLSQPRDTDPDLSLDLSLCVSWGVTCNL